MQYCVEFVCIAMLRCKRFCTEFIISASATPIRLRARTVHIYGFQGRRRSGLVDLKRLDFWNLDMEKKSCPSVISLTGL